jgi:hypothetical protein
LQKVGTFVKKTTILYYEPVEDPSESSSGPNYVYYESSGGPSESSGGPSESSGGPSEYPSSSGDYFDTNMYPSPIESSGNRPVPIPAKGRNFFEVLDIADVEVVKGK